MNLTEVHRTFLEPPREFGLIPLWLWNDDLREEELLRQLREFHRAGFGGVCPHPRLGLSKRVGYLTDEYFRLVRVVVDECARLGMKVLLYDEGAYPSGSAGGKVVAANPDHASQCIGLWEKDVTGPWRGFWRPNTGRPLLDKHVVTVLGRMRDDGRIDPGSVRVLEPERHDIVAVDVPAGRWKAMSVWQMASGGRIRGVFAEEEDGHATAPASADLLNPDAVACFIRLTHDGYYRHLKDHFGKTIIGMFTDEPNVLGRGPYRLEKPHAFTAGLVEWLQKRWGSDPRPWLPALWLDYGDGTAEFRARYSRAIHDRLHEVYYAAQSNWCADHGIALTGHPSASNDMTSLGAFQIPGQDMVWRWVVPNSPTALEGADSLAPKTATSAARVGNRRRILTEVAGAYGWRLTLDELKWLLDWHLVRGNNLFCAHAVYYSIRDRRAWESEPDLGVHNVWWPYFHHVAGYVRRVSWMLADGQQVCDVAVLGDGHNLPWAAAKVLYQNQIDFLYIDDVSLAKATVGKGVLNAGAQVFRAIVMDGNPPLSAPAQENLRRFADGGGTLLRYVEPRALLAELDAAVPRDVRLTPPNADLRFTHYRKDGLDFYYLVNEGEDPIRGELRINVVSSLVSSPEGAAPSAPFPALATTERRPPVSLGERASSKQAPQGAVESWDPLTGNRTAVPARRIAGSLIVDLELERRASTILVVDPKESPAAVPAKPAKTDRAIPVVCKWEVRDAAGKKLAVPAPGDWARCPGFELFTGTLVYAATVDVPAGDDLRLDLGQVGDIAEVFVDGQSQGAVLWAPHRIRLRTPPAPGQHRLEVRVTNSMVNEYEGVQAPSGLIGPVCWMVRDT